MCMNKNENNSSMKLQYVELTKVREFNHLGSTVQNNENHRLEIKKRVIAAWNGWGKATGIICDEWVSAKVRVQVCGAIRNVEQHRNSTTDQKARSKA